MNFPFAVRRCVGEDDTAESLDISSFSSFLCAFSAFRELT